MDFNKMTVEELDEFINALIKIRDVKKLQTQVGAEIDLSSAITKTLTELDNVLGKFKQSSSSEV